MKSVTLLANCHTFEKCNTALCLILGPESTVDRLPALGQCGGGNAGEKVALAPVVKSLAKTGCPAAKDAHGSRASERIPMPKHPLNALTRRDLLAMASRRQITFDDVDLAVLARETLARLGKMLSRVRQGQFVEEASEFARWVNASGLTKPFREPDRLACEKLIADIMWDCEETRKNHGRKPWVPVSELEALNAKFDAVMAVVTSLAKPGILTDENNGRILMDAKKPKALPCQP